MIVAITTPDPLNGEVPSITDTESARLLLLYSLARLN